MVDQSGAIRVDQTVRHYDASGQLLAMARVPLAEYYTYVAHGLAAGPEGGVYALITYPDRAEVQRLHFVHELDPLLPSVPPSSVQGLVAPTSSCVTRDMMMNIASFYTGNSKYLNSTNTDGNCPGRGKPRYIGGPGTYSSVPYDWGGWDTVSGYNNYMDSNYQAGDIDTAGVEGCSRGVDCSGFVSRVWQLSSKHSTWTLPNVSWELPSTNYLLRGDIMNKAGDHVVLFASFATNGINDYEATTYNAYDRVYYTYSSWSRLTGYEPRRYNDVCPGW